MKKYVGIAAAVIFLPVCCVFVLNNGVPFIEGDTSITNAKVYGFTIGATKSDCFAEIKRSYNDQGNDPRVVWSRNSLKHRVLRKYDGMKGWDRKHGEYKEAISEDERHKKIITIPKLG